MIHIPQRINYLLLAEKKMSLGKVRASMNCFIKPNPEQQEFTHPAEAFP